MEKKIEISTDFIKLDQFIKYAGVVQTGGESKLLIKDDQVRVNGQIENKRGRKLVKGDIIEIENIETFIVV